MYAVVRIGGKQYRVEKGDSLVVDRMPEDEGAKVSLEPLMFRGDGKDEAVFSGDDLGKVKVEATIAGHLRGKKPAAKNPAAKKPAAKKPAAKKPAAKEDTDGS